MKKTIAALMALIASSSIFVGCTTTQSDQIELLWWNDYNQDSTSDTSRYDFAQSVIEDFEELYPNVTVKQVQYSSYSEIATQITNGLSTHNVPNLASVYPDDAATFGDTVLHAAEYFDDEEVGFGKTVNSDGEVVDDPYTLKDDIDWSSEIAAYGEDEDDFLTLPYSRSSEALFINQTVFDKVGAGECGHTASEDSSVNGGEQYIAPVAAESKVAYEVPTTWGEMIALARQMKVDFPELFADQIDEDGWFKAVPICYDSSENLFISLCKMMGIDYTSDSAPTFNNDDVKKMLIQLKKWVNEGLICTSNQLMMSTPIYHSYSTSMVNYGSVFMLISSTTSGSYLYADGYVASVHATPTANKSDFPEFESNEQGTHYAISQGPSLVLFRDSDEEVEKATFNFYKFLTNTQNNASFAATVGYFPIRSSSNEEEAVQNIIDAADDEISEYSTDEEAWAAKRNTYTGQAYQLNVEYTEEEAYFAATVYSNSNCSSAGARDAVGALVDAVIEGNAETDEEIEALVETQMSAAFSQAANN